MADLKLSQLASIPSPLTGSELVYIVQSGVGYSCTATDLLTFVSASLAVPAEEIFINFSGANIPLGAIPTFMVGVWIDGVKATSGVEYNMSGNTVVFDVTIFPTGVVNQTVTITYFHL